MKRFESTFGMLVVLALSFFAVKELFLPGFFSIHDNTQLERVYQMAIALSDGILHNANPIVRWVPDLGYGYGYPIFNFYAPLAYYVGAIFYFVFGSVLFATKLMIAFAVLLSGIGMYYLARSFFGTIGGIFSALLYVYAPYHALDIYVRGDIAEVYAYAFIPFVFYSLWQFYKTKRFRYVVFGALSYAAVITSHNLTALMITPFILVASLVLSYAFLKRRDPQSILTIFGLIALGTILSCFYWIPALLEMPYTNVFSQIGGGANYKDHFVCLNQLWESQWGYGGSTPTCIDGMSYRLGKLHIILALAAVVFVIVSWKKKNEQEVYALALSLVFLTLSLLLTLQVTKPLWDIVSIMAFFQYPWRFLIIASFFISFVGGSVFYFLKLFIRHPLLHKITVAIFVLFFIPLFLLYGKLFVPQTILARDESFYTDTKHLRWDASRISDEYMPKEFIKPNSLEEIPTKKFVVERGDAEIEEAKISSTRNEIIVRAEEPSTIRVNIAYFPGWETVIKEGARIDIDNKGWVFSVPKGEHYVLLWFAETATEHVANFVSIAGMVILVAGIIYSRKQRSL